MRRPLVAANWKMNTTVPEGLRLVVAMVDRLVELSRDVDVVLCPPFTSVFPVYQLLADTPISLGAQDVHWEPRGAYTGEISAPMLRPFCRYVIVGHSERRQYFGETDETVARKLRAATGAGLIPILCVGENLAENEAGLTLKVVTRQLEAALTGWLADCELVIAYEPVWAIGTGRPATGEQAGRVIGEIRGMLGRMFGVEYAGRTRILYGGSVSPENIAEFVGHPEVDGALVGGASLRANDFVDIVRITANLAGKAVGS
jgi:triosephosphate isomerase